MQARGQIFGRNPEGPRQRVQIFGRSPERDADKGPKELGKPQRINHRRWNL